MARKSRPTPGPPPMASSRKPSIVTMLERVGELELQLANQAQEAALASTMVPPNGGGPGQTVLSTWSKYQQELAYLSTIGTISNVLNFGADPTGATDSTAAIQAAINENPAVYVPTGLYLVNSGPLAPVSNMHFLGDGRGLSRITSTSNPIWNMATASPIQNLEIAGFTFTVTNADMFNGANISRLALHDCQLIQNSSAYSIWNGAGLTQTIECRFYRNEEFVHGVGGRTVPAWNLTSPNVVINQNVWRDIVTFNNDHDTAQYHYRLACTPPSINAGFRANTFENVAMEYPTGGAIRLESCTGTKIDQIMIWDIASLPLGNPLISLVRNNPSATGTQSTIISNYARGGGSTISSTYPDIQCDGNCVQTTIINPSVNGGGAQLTIDLGNSALNTLLGLPVAYTLVNTTTATYADFNGGSYVPAAQQLKLQATTPAAGYTVINGTGALGVSWTTPNDGNIHRFIIYGTLHTTSSQTGGQIQVQFTMPDGATSTINIFVGGQGVGFHFIASTQVMVQANTVVSLSQTTAQTGGAAIAWAEIWGI